MIFSINRSFLFVIVALFLTLTSCNEPTPKTEETPVSGILTVYCDESFKPLLVAENSVFEALYPKASLKLQYIPEIKAINALLKDSVELIVTGRPLNKTEKDFMAKKEAAITESHIATDALTFVWNKSVKDSIISSENLKALLSGKINTWKDINPSLPGNPVTIVFDQSNSSNLNRAITQFDLDPKKVKIFAAGSNIEVCNYVKTNPNALGVISASWISDEEAPESRKIRNEVKVISIKDKDGTIFSPFQASIYSEKNPFRRDIYIIRRNKNIGLGTGFLSFILSERGQRIVLKSGLLPAIMPGREIIINPTKQ